MPAGASRARMIRAAEITIDLRFPPDEATYPDTQDVVIEDSDTRRLLKS
jgi:hypothetical protein